MDVAKTSSLLSGSMPPVSTMVNSRPFQSAVWYERSRVTPRDSWTMASGGLGQAVNERGLAHVGASDDGDDRFHLHSFNG